MRNAIESQIGPAALPQRCHVVVPGLPAGANVGVCVRGRAGLILTGLNLGACRQARAAVRAMNAAIGVTAVAEHAMLAGAMLGWHCAMADPVYLSLNDRRFTGGGRSAGRVLH